MCDECFMIFTPYPTLHTERLILRELRDTDAEALYGLRTDTRVNQYIKRAAMTSVPEAARYIEHITEGITSGMWIYWAICLQHDDHLIGTICLWQFTPDREQAEIGYEMYPTYQGQGVMSEAIRAVIDYGVEQLGLVRLEAYTHRDNAQSIRLLERFDFVLDEEQVDEHNKNNVIYVWRKMG